MLIEPIFHRAGRAGAGERAEAARAVAGALLYADLGPRERASAESALTAALDDPSGLVRRALAETLAAAVDAPHHLVVALAGDQSDIAAIVLERSPILLDAELVDAVAVGDGEAQAAVARRPGLSAAVAGALAEVGARDAALALCRNHDADLAPVSARRLIERFGDDGEVRDALGNRTDLDAALRHDLVVATADALARFVADRAWLSPERARRVAGEARDRATVTLGADSAREGDASGFVAHLAENDQLTPALALRAVLSGEIRLFEAALASLAGRTPAQVAGLVARPAGLGFAALFRKAGLPPGLLPVFRAALAATRPTEADDEAGSATLRRPAVEQVLAACLANPALGTVVALLRRFESEAARDETRQRATGRVDTHWPRAARMGYLSVEAELAVAA